MTATPPASAPWPRLQSYRGELKYEAFQYKVAGDGASIVPGGIEMVFVRLQYHGHHKASIVPGGIEIRQRPRPSAAGWGFNRTGGN